MDPFVPGAWVGRLASISCQPATSFVVSTASTAITAGHECEQAMLDVS